MAWTRDRLENVVRERLGDSKLIVVANREPYIHTYQGEEITCTTPASGLTTALDPVMRACGGSWVGHGGGGADRGSSGSAGRVGGAPAGPKYTPRRGWLTKGGGEGYYYGFANEG